jgi:HD superfamily phosphohydrolase YqeK
MAGDVFFSYRSKDIQVVDKLYEGLRRVGGFDQWQLWRDRNSLVPGKEWYAQIESASSRARVLVAVIGSDWRPKDSKGDWVSRELKAAFAQNMAVLPLLIDQAPLPHPEDLPEELAPLCDIQCLRIEASPTDSNCYTLKDALRKRGVRPARNTDPWSRVPINTLSTVPKGEASFRVVLVSGSPGSGRTSVLREFRDSLCARAPEGAGGQDGHRALVGWHAPLNTSTRHDCAILHDWLPNIFAGVSPADLQSLARTLLASGIVEASTRLVPLAALAARFELDLRLGVVRELGRRDAGERHPRVPSQGGAIADAASRLPLALAAKLLSDLGSSAGSSVMPLALIVDDFDFADAKSRDFVRELVRSRRSAYGGGQDRPLTLVLNTENADETEAFLGFQGLDRRPERLVTGGKTDEDQRSHLEEFVTQCVAGTSGSLPEETKPLLECLTSICRSPFEVEVVLRYLHRQGTVTKSKGGNWAPSGAFSSDSLRTEALDQTISLWLEPAMQQILETGALVGMSFVADFADTAVNGPNLTASPGADKSLWQQIRESDQDEIIVRCREVDGRKLITFTSALWRQHLRDRPDDTTLQERRIRALAERYAAAAKAEDRYDDWVTAACLAAQVGSHEEAGRAFLNSARLARQQLSVDVAADRYFDARDVFSLAAATDDATVRARALTVMAFASLQAVSLRLRSTWKSQLDFPRELENVGHMISEIRGAVGRLPLPPAIGRIENLALDLTDSYLSDADKLAARRHSLASHWAILSGRLKLRDHPGLELSDRTSGPGAKLEEVARETEWLFAGALRDAEQGLAGPVGRHLVILSATGMAQALTLKAQLLAHKRLDAQTTTGPLALENVVANALFHACRALLLLGRWRGAFTDALSISDIEESERNLLECVVKLGATRGIKLHVRPSEEVGQRSVADLTEAWAQALAPRRYQHMNEVSAKAAELAGPMREQPEESIGQHWAEDIRVMAFAHDLFRDVEPTRILALFRELDMPGTHTRPDGSLQPGPGEPEDWIQPAEWRIPILLHGRLAAAFLDFVLDAYSRLGGDRFSQIRHALATHTVGKRNAPPLSRLLVVADTLQVLSKDVESKENGAREHSGRWLPCIKDACAADPSLVKVYWLCMQARVEHLHHIGTTPAEETLRVVHEHPG